MTALVWLLLLLLAACAAPVPEAETDVTAVAALPQATAVAGGVAPAFYVPAPNTDAVAQIARLEVEGEAAAARGLAAMIAQPQAVWFTGSAPRQIEQQVRGLVGQAAAAGAVPLLVAYNIPFRDCAQFSAGGARNPAEYVAWIEAFAAGIGDETAVVILEPDGLGIIPWYKPFAGTAAAAATYEWCQPGEGDEATAAAERLAMLNQAVDALAGLPDTAVYLDGTHSGWLSVADAAHRLRLAGVDRAAGFFLNVSNYQHTADLEAYGRQISDCLFLAAAEAMAIERCPGGPGADAAYDRAYEAAGLARDPAAQPHFVIDTSRNGQGPWTPPPGFPDPQDWCNPPDRGLGARPAAQPGPPLLDAYLWIKTPGESDGECTRGLGPAGSTVDPAWELVGPPAGAWFPEMALQLAQNAVPPLE